MKATISEAVLEAAVLQAARHQFRLDDDDFYREETPDGKTRRRVSGRVEAYARKKLKARYTDQVQQEAHDLFQGRIGLQRLIEAALTSWGHKGEVSLRTHHGVTAMMRAWDHQEATQPIRAEGASTVSLSNVLANVMNKFALQGYLYTEQSWREVAAIKPVNDFKPAKSINLLGDVMYKQVGATGELQNASLGDQAFANQAGVYGRILTLPWQHIVNDDLGMLTGAPTKVGQGAGLALNDAFWTLWKNMAAGTVNGDDNNPFWRTTSSVTQAAIRAGTAYMPNKITGAGSAVSLAALNAARAAHRNQIDPNGNPLGFDGMQPVILYGPSNYQSWMALLYAGTLVYGGSTSGPATPNYNSFNGKFKPVESAYLENPNYVNSATAWWMLHDPTAFGAVEVCFLNGVDTPEVLTAGPDYQFDRLGISIRGTMPFGVNQQNFRAGVYNVGA